MPVGQQSSSNPPSRPHKKPSSRVDGQDLEGGRDIGLRQPGAAAGQAGEGDGVVDGGVSQGVVWAGDQTVDAGDGAATVGREVDHKLLLSGWGQSNGPIIKPSSLGQQGRDHVGALSAERKFG